jgi:hypothetical protein
MLGIFGGYGEAAIDLWAYPTHPNLTIDQDGEKVGFAYRVLRAVDEQFVAFFDQVFTTGHAVIGCQDGGQFIFI